jgi:hypothetical protein
MEQQTIVKDVHPVLSSYLRVAEQVLVKLPESGDGSVAAMYAESIMTMIPDGDMREAFGDARQDLYEEYCGQYRENMTGNTQGSVDPKRREWLQRMASIKAGIVTIGLMNRWMMKRYGCDV